jgi:hypothetical protein
MKIISYELLKDPITKDHIGFIKCLLDDKMFIEFECFSFFCWVEEKDQALAAYEKKFDTWELFIADLEEIGYDLTSQLNEFMNSLPEYLIEESIYHLHEISN